VIFIDKASFNFTMNDDNGLYVFTTKQDLGDPLSPTHKPTIVASSRTSIGQQDAITAEVGLGKQVSSFEKMSKNFALMKFNDVPVAIA
jgi:hypothetical protein